MNQVKGMVFNIARKTVQVLELYATPNYPSKISRATSNNRKQLYNSTAKNIDFSRWWITKSRNRHNIHRALNIERTKTTSRCAF